MFVEFENARGLFGDVEEITANISDAYPNSSYEMFIHLYAAKDAADESNWEEALNQLVQALEITTDQTYGDIIRLRKARLEIQLDRSQEALATLSDVGAGYEQVVHELTGDIYRADNQIELAVAAYENAKTVANSWVDTRRIDSKIYSMPATVVESETPDPSSATDSEPDSLGSENSDSETDVEVDPESNESS